MSSNAWMGIIKATAQQYVRGAADLTIRNRLFLAMLQRRGRIVYNQTGTSLKWQLEYSSPPVETYGDGGNITFAPHDFLKQLEVDWRGYKSTDQLTKFKELQNGDGAALVSYYKTMVPRLTKAITNKFSSELFIDGNATGNEQRIHGLNTFTGTGTTVVGDIAAYPSDTYCGLSTVPGTYGGSWTSALTTKPNAALATDWPNGNGDPEYDFLSPKLVNWSSNAWGTSSTTFANNGELALRQMKIWCTQLGGMEGAPDIHLMSGNLYNEYLNSQRSLRHAWVPIQEATDLGFPNTVNQEGVIIQEDFDVPVNSFFTLNLDKMEVRCLTSQLFDVSGPNWDTRSDAWLTLISFFGNATFEPKFQGKGYNYAAS